MRTVSVINPAKPPILRTTFATWSSNASIAYDQRRYEEAVHWYSQAAVQGHAQSQYYLGCCYEEGKGVLQNYETAAYWYGQAAAQGHSGARLKLGKYYAKGIGVRQNYLKAACYYLEAASTPGHEQAKAEARYYLGCCYAKGQGVPQNHAVAMYWYRQAAAQNNAAARSKLATMGITI